VAGQRLDVQLVDGATFDAVQAELGSRAVHVDRPALTIGVATDGSAAETRWLLDQLDPQQRRIDRFTLHTASLDDVFLELTGHRTSTFEKETTNV
jgi:ABC-2 type transport system ATP-binding protein